MTGVDRLKLQGPSKPSSKQAAISSENIKRLNADPDFVAKRTAAIRARHANDPEFAARVRAHLERLNADPEFAAKRIAAARASWTDPQRAAARKAAASERLRRLYDDPEFGPQRRAAAVKHLNRLHADPHFKAAARKRMQRLNAERQLDRVTQFYSLMLHHCPNWIDEPEPPTGDALRREVAPASP